MYWTPNVDDGSVLNGAVLGSATSKPIEPPKEGDKILLEVYQYGGANIFNQEFSSPNKNNLYIEVEVKGIKKAKIDWE